MAAAPEGMGLHHQAALCVGDSVHVLKGVFVYLGMLPHQLRARAVDEYVRAAELFCSDLHAEKQLYAQLFSSFKCAQVFSYVSFRKFSGPGVGYVFFLIMVAKYKPVYARVPGGAQHGLAVRAAAAAYPGSVSVHVYQHGIPPEYALCEWALVYGRALPAQDF